MALTSGTRLGPYEIQSPIGAGGMGEVYRARDTRLDRTVAIKIIPPHLSDDMTRRQRFEREAKVISSLNHPHICTLYDVGRQDGVDFIVMEYLEGESLAERLGAGPLPIAQVLQYGSQIASALDKAHRGGVLHRDLKPGNIMLTKAGAKLLDFGLATAAPPLAGDPTLTDMTPRVSPLTQQGVIVGTVQYMSPEQVEGKELDARSDIFSLGAGVVRNGDRRPRLRGQEPVERGLRDTVQGPKASRQAAAAHAAGVESRHRNLPGQRTRRTLAVGGGSLERTATH